MPTARPKAPVALGEQGAELVEAGVRVDPPGSGAAKDRLALERETRGVRQEVADGRVRRAGGLVQVDEAVLDRIEDGHGRGQLGHRGPAEAASSSPWLAMMPPGTTMATAACVGSPAVDGRERGADIVHGG